MDENYYNNDTKSMQEDLLIYKAASVIHNICLFVLDEFNMKFSIEIKIKLTSFKSTTNIVNLNNFLCFLNFNS